MNNKVLLVICFLELFIIGYLINDRKNYEPSVPKSEELQKESSDFRKLIDEAL